MLVLSRREGEKIVFPTIGVTLEVLQVKGNAARLGIKAPKDVRILREELAPDAAPPQLSDHKFRNQLHAIAMGAYLMRRQFEQGLDEAAEKSYQQIVADLKALEDEAASRKLQESPSMAKVIKQACRALVVEDDQNECELLAGILRLSGYEVATSGDGCDALSYLSTHERPDVLLLDMIMPRCDGPRTVKALRQDPKLADIKVIAISGKSPESLGLETGPRGVDRWFRKPLNPEVLMRELSRDMEEKCRGQMGA